MKKRYILGALLFIIMGLLYASAFGTRGHTYQRIGLKYLDQKKPENAVKYLKKAVDKDRNNQEYHIDLGFAYIQNHQMEQALIEFDYVLASNSKKINEKIKKAAFRGEGIAYYSGNHPDLAVGAFAKALDIKKSSKMNQDILKYQGMAYLKLGEYARAEEVFTKAINKDKKNAVLYSYRAKARFYLEETEDAAKDYEKAISLDKKEYRYYADLCAVLKSSGKEAVISSTINQALQLKAKSDEDHYYVALLNFYDGEEKKASKGLKMAAKKEIYEAYFYLGELAYQNEDYISSSLYYEKYLEMNKGQLIQMVYNQLALSLMKMERYQEAAKVLDQGIEQVDAATMQKLLFNQIIVCENTGEFDLAFEKSKEYMALYPEDTEVQRELDFLTTRASR